MQRFRCAFFRVVVLIGLSAFIVTVDTHTAQAEKGMIRVLLTFPGITNRVTVSLDGSYTLGELCFQRGSVLIISSASGSLNVYYEGMAFDAGKELRLVRHEVDVGEENGIRLEGMYPLYCGDLVLSVNDKSITAVLHITVEEYLLGVVPWEMSDSFSLEALKAQAIAARTYALSRAGGSGKYDVTDNTNDQVYRGWQKEHVNSARAVTETKGICGFYQGQPALCYYTASNGGQVEIPSHVWGGEENTYITQHTDQYDLENPESPVVTARIAKKAKDGMLGNEAFTRLVMAEIKKQAEKTLDETADIRITEVQEIGLQHPAYGKDSALMTQMMITCLLDGKGKSVTVALPVFPDAEYALGLSLNTEDNEIWTARDAGEEYVIEARRYGHGVGLSQRGAQWMADRYGWTYEQIFRFYYPGLELKKADTDVTPAPAVRSDFLATPGPAATPTPRPTLMPVTSELKAGEWKAIVNGIGANSSLNLRSAPGMQADVIRLLYYGQELIVEETLPDGWLKVRTDAVDGYVMAKFTEKIPD